MNKIKMNPEENIHACLDYVIALVAAETVHVRAMDMRFCSI